ncbi:chromosome transmission fidelity protein 8 homolog [Centruroides vittatus]|uniref:chromosome transmission fidelity protein 8 homolog n=1 Tax=Centruroides vittatus TaxID=120091 RepID=UPI00350F260A
MVQIVIKSKETGDVAEWSILELQGDLECTSEQDLRNQFVGDLHYTKNGVPILIIGHHILFGKVVELQKPFAILKRERTETSTEYAVTAVIRRKVLFRTRPKPIVSKRSEGTPSVGT